MDEFTSDGMLDDGIGSGGMDFAEQFDAGGDFGGPFASGAGGLDSMYVPNSLAMPTEAEPDFHVTPIEYEDDGQPKDFIQQLQDLAHPKPFGVDDDGVPVYKIAPIAGPSSSLSEIEGEFIAPVYHIGSPIEWVKFPEAGEERDSMLKEISEQFMSEYASDQARQTAIRQMEQLHYDELHSQHENEMAKLECDAQIREISNYQHELELAGINNMSLDQYRTTHEMGLERIDKSLGSHSDMFKDSNGNIYRVDVDGTATRIVVV